MARTTKRNIQRKASRSAPPKARKAAPRRATAARKHDPLDDFIIAAAGALDLPAEKAWLPAIKSNLRVTLQLAAVVAAFKLPDDAEPAPVFKA